MSRLSAALTEALLSMLAPFAVCFAQQHFDYTKPLNVGEARGELDTLKHESLMRLLMRDPQSRVYQDSESDVYFTRLNAIGEVGASYCRQRDLPNHHERCFNFLRIYHHSHAASPVTAGALDGRGAASPVDYWAISEGFQIMCEDSTIREMGSVVYRESSDGDGGNLWNGDWDDSSYGLPAARSRPIDTTDQLAVLAREKLCKG